MSPIMTRSFAILLAAAGGGIRSAEPAPASVDTELWYEKPAEHWLAALPVGNGRMGGMVFGGVPVERIQFNEQTLWLGSEKTREMGSYQPFGDVLLELAHGDRPVTGYRRDLDLDSAIARVRYTIDGVEHRREYFASHPDRAIVMRLTASKPGQVSLTIGLRDVRPNKVRIDGGIMTFAGDLSQGLAWAEPAAAPPAGNTRIGGGETPNDLAYAAALRVLPEGGRLVASPTGLAVEQADAVTLILAAATSFANDPAKRWRGDQPQAAVSARLAAAAQRSHGELRAAHIADHRALFRRVRLDLGASPVSRQPTPQRLHAVRTGARDPALPTLLFNYGRYLLIASSRPGGLPANLQGLWNADVRPAWYSGYTTNINVEMNYWAAEVAALPECHQPLLDWIDRLATVQRHSEDPRLKTSVGWIVYSTNNPYGGNSGWAIHQPGSAWLARHFWEHYLFGLDRDFLARRAYPHLREIALYWHDRLVPGPGGSLVTPDGWSPEHGPVMEHGRMVLKEGDRTPHPGVSYDQQIVWDLFTNFLEAAAVLGVDPDLRARIAAARSRLLGPRVGRWGQLQEWMEDIDDPNDRHRHVSHLFALHPGRQISPLLDAAVAEAARVSLQARGDAAAGWSRAWKINFWARLLEGDRAESVLRGLLSPVAPGRNESGSLPNLFGSGPPFQMDSNFGATAGIAEMLLQSHLTEPDGTRVIHLLPALPAAWPDGRVSGLRARGGFEVSLAWQAGRLAAATLLSRDGTRAHVRYGSTVRPLNLSRNERFEWTPPP